jgi:hypothetical protein
MWYFVEFWACIERRQMGSRDQAEDRGNQKVDAKGHEPSAPPEEGVLMSEDQEDDCARKAPTGASSGACTNLPTL